MKNFLSKPNRLNILIKGLIKEMVPANIQNFVFSPSSFFIPKVLKENVTGTKKCDFIL